MVAPARAPGPPVEDLATADPCATPRGSPAADRGDEGAPMSKHGKGYDDAAKRLDRDRLYSPTEALEQVKSLASRKFDESVDVAIRLGVDPRKAEQMIRGTVSLPHGTGKTVRVIAFAAGDAARDAEA